MNLLCLGIDIAKVKFNVCLLQLSGKLKHKVFPNNLAAGSIRSNVTSPRNIRLRFFDNLGD